MSKDIMPLPSVEGLGAGVTSRVPTLTRLTGTKALKPSPLMVTDWNQAHRWWSDSDQR